MTDESVIRLLLLAVLVRQVIGYWALFGQQWQIGERIKQWHWFRSMGFLYFWQKSRPMGIFRVVDIRPYLYI